MFQDGGSVVVDSLFIVAPIVCEDFVYDPSFAMQYDQICLKQEIEV